MGQTDERQIRLTRSAGVASWLGRPLPPGPWHDEPDHEEFRSPDDVPCILHRGPLGAWCGYVAVAPGHPWHGKEYDSVAAEAHGGLTYADSCQGDICHVPKDGESDDVWWVGFDCNHSSDLSLYDIADGSTEGERFGRLDSYKRVGYARAQTLALAEQAHAARLCA